MVSSRKHSFYPPAPADPAGGEGKRPGLGRALLWSLAALAVVAIALMVLAPRDNPLRPGAWSGGGVMDLELVRVRMGEALPQGAVVEAREGDRLQFALSSSVPTWAQVYDFQDDGLVQTWLEPTEVVAKQPVVQAVLLDAYAGDERVFFLLSPEPIPLERARQAGEQIFEQDLAELDRLPGFGAEVVQRSVLIVKEPGS